MIAKKQAMIIIQLFDQYSQFYQPYIPPVVTALLERKDINLKIVAFRGRNNKEDDVKVLPHYIKRKVFAKLLQQGSKVYRNLDYFEIKALRDKVDIIHLQHSYLHSKIIRLLARPSQNRPKIVITLRGADTYVRPWVRSNWRDFYRDYGNKVDAFITMSEHQKNYLHTKWGVEKERIHLIPISFGTAFEVEPKTPDPATIKLVSVFRMCWEKNIVDNLRFVKAVKERNVPITYVVYGDGPDLGQLYYLRDQYGLTEEVTILGSVPNEVLKKDLKQYDFILQLSHSESLGMSVIEAQSYGVPAIVSNNGGLPEVIINGKNGVVIDLENIEVAVQEVISIWSNPNLYCQYAHHSINQVHQNYTIENEVEKLKNLYFKLT